MSAGGLCGVPPFFLRNKFSGFEPRNRHENARADTNTFNESSKKGKNVKGSTIRGWCGGTGNFVAMTELRNKISTLRDLLDFSPCVGTASAYELLILTLTDFFKRYPKIKLSEIEDVPMHKALRLLCDTLKSLGDLWTNGKWMVRCRYDSSKKLEHFDLEQIVLGMLEDIIQLVRARLYDETDVEEEEDTRGSNNRQSNAFGKALSESYPDSPTSLSAFPMTPTSVLPDAWRSSSLRETGSSYSPPMKLNAIDVKRLSFHMYLHVAAPAQHENCRDMAECRQESKRPSQVPPDDDETMGDMEIKDYGTEFHDIARKWTGIQPQQECNNNNSHNSNTPPPPPPLPLPPTNKVQSVPFPPPPPPLPVTKPSPQPLMANRAPPPPPPPPGSKVVAPLTPPPPPLPGSNGAAPPPPPPLGAKGGSPPPPPPGFAWLGAKKATTNLKRSSQMGNLYRLLKGKVEGSSLDGKPSGRRNSKVGGAASGGKQGMADALAEMTKRSAYFQQIEEDVKKYAGTVNDLKIEMSSFETSDMSELIKFHKRVESQLEKLTDETQVLARFEDFPGKKLEALRMGAALYSKLDSIASTLQKWPIVSPVGQLLDKAESYFNKIKVELDALERTKDEELKRFKAQKINFDFGILLRIKELMVDVSSSCMELTLKERREAAAKENREPSNKPDPKKNSSAKMMWRAFQFAFRVYTFAGGHDDRADKLTRELADEIETQQ